MPDEVLEEYIKQTIAAHKIPEVTFAWQGGEPTILGLDFFKKA
ncbi:MAG: atsB-2, partial [Deltaproteobacteria bacterium]|nr:atsB-2 [Deltaproteobacteria bacterium]